MKAQLVSLQKFKTDYFKKYQDLLIRESGFFFAENRMEFFRSTLLQFISKSPYDTFEDFLNYLSNTSPGKLLLQQMMDEITIGETFFFRNMPQLDTFKEYVIPELIKAKRSTGVPIIKIWSAGCSSGEEVYTNAMLLLENLPNPNTWEIHILGTDINRRFLRIAEEGIYKGTRPEKHVDQALLQKYFTYADGQYRINNELKNIVKFAHHNLIQSPYDMFEMIDADVIFCRNVTIYFNTETTRMIINKFYDCLRDKGYLFLGHSETLWKICDKFRVYDFPKGFIYQKDLYHRDRHAESNTTHAAIPEINLNLMHQIKDTGYSSKTPFSLESLHPSSPASLSTEEIDSDLLENLMKIDTKYHEGCILFENKDFEGALKCFDEIIVKDSSYLIAHFAKATILSNQGKYQEALKAFQHLINADNLFLEAYYLQSILYIKLQDLPKAISTLQKVIYIDPNHALGYFNLATLYNDCGKPVQSKLAWTNLKRVCQLHAKTAIVPLSDNMTYETLETLADRCLSEFK